MKTTVPRKQMRMLQDQSEELSYLRINAATIKLLQLNILKKEKKKNLRDEKQLEKFWDSFNTKFSKKKWSKQRKVMVENSSCYFVRNAEKNNAQIHNLEPY